MLSPKCLQRGVWRSFPKPPPRLQYVGNANYYAQVLINGKLICA